MTLKLEKKLNIYSINEVLAFKKLYSISKKLESIGNKINNILNYRKSKLKQPEEEIEDIPNKLVLEVERKNIITDILNNYKHPDYPLKDKLQTLKKNKKKTFELDLTPNKILFNRYLKVLTYKCKIEESLIFSMFARDSNQKIKFKFPFINKILEMYMMRRKKYEEKKNEINHENNKELDVDIAKFIRKDIENKVLQHLAISETNLDDHLADVVINAWRFRYKNANNEKYFQIQLNSLVDKDKALSYDIYEKIDKFDFIQVLDFNFKYILPYFSIAHWCNPIKPIENQTKNKSKMIFYFNNLMKTIYFILKTKYQQGYIFGLDILKVN